MSTIDSLRDLTGSLRKCLESEFLAEETVIQTYFKDLALRLSTYGVVKFMIVDNYPVNITPITITTVEPIKATPINTTKLQPHELYNRILNVIKRQYGRNMKGLANDVMIAWEITTCIRDCGYGNYEAQWTANTI